MKRSIPALLCLLLLAGCSTVLDTAHQARVAALRARVPYLTRIGITRSMDTVLDANQLCWVISKPYDKLQSHDIAIFLPESHADAICHFVGHRIGTDSWSTYSMATTDDLRQQGFLLTRENYIGIIK